MAQRRYLATFAAGFEPVIGEILAESLAGSRVVRIESGMVLFDYQGRFDKAASIESFNNVFLVINEWKAVPRSFFDMVRGAESARMDDAAAACRACGARSFRVRFSRENAFESVDKKITAAAERLVSEGTGLASDRFSPGIEFWFIARREGYGCFALRLTRKQSAGKILAQGELRPEICRLAIALAGIGDGARILVDPFAGHGAIPAALARVHPSATVHASDASAEMVAALERRFAGNDSRVSVHRCDALELSYCPDGSVDAIVTDPPWGEWEGSTFGRARSLAELYRSMLEEFDRVLAPSGKACVLTGAKREFEEALAGCPAFADSAGKEGFRTDILVNGKKCAVFVIARSARQAIR